MLKDRLVQIIEALIFASDGPLTIAHMETILEDVPKSEIENAITELSIEFEKRAFSIKKLAGGYEFATRPEFARWINRMYETKSRSRLTRAALETLAIVAFKQPISRIEIAAIRGVNSDGVVKSLLEKKLITITGRAEGPGRPLLLATTKDFLRYFSINDIADLPKPKEIEALLAEGEGSRILQEISEESLFSEQDNQQEKAQETVAKDGSNHNPADGHDENQ